MQKRTWSLAFLCALGCAVGCNADHPDTDAKGATSAAPASSAAAAASGAPAASASAASAAASSSAAPATTAAAAAAEASTRLTIDGKPEQGGLLHAKVSGRVKQISFPGHKTTILDDGEFLIGFAGTAPAKETLKLTFDDGVILTRELDVEQRKYDVDKIDGLPKNEVELDAATKKKLAEASAKIDDVRAKFTKSDCYKQAFQWPVEGKITTRYGQPRVLDGHEAGPHWGVDIVAAKGKPVRAPACGKVVYVEKNVPLSGNVIIVDHGRGLTSTFLHLDSFKVKVGDEVKQGDEIGTVGATGRATGPHLDWRMNLYDLHLDPELVAPPMK